MSGVMATRRDEKNIIARITDSVRDLEKCASKLGFRLAPSVCAGRPDMKMVSSTAERRICCASKRQTPDQKRPESVHSRSGAVI